MDNGRDRMDRHVHDAGGNQGRNRKGRKGRLAQGAPLRDGDLRRVVTETEKLMQDLGLEIVSVDGDAAALLRLRGLIAKRRNKK